MIKQRIKSVARKMAGWPIIGRYVRIGVAIIRLPDLRTDFLDLKADYLNRKNRQDQDADIENLVKSIPVTLRRIIRDIIDIRGKLDSITNSMDQRLNETHGKLDSITNSMDQRLNETHGKLDSITNSVDYLLGRVEFVRRELMFEMRYGASSPSIVGDQITTKTEILDREKLENARSGRLRLNLGCGHVPIDGYINIDRRALHGVDIVAEVDDLPFEQGEVDEIFSAHLLEHFPQEQLRRELLPYWIGLLKPGGVFGAVVPDADSMIKEYVRGVFPYNSLREVTFGAQDYDGDFHYNMFVPEQIEQLLKEAGLADIQWLAMGRRNGACFEMEFKGIKK